MTDLKPASLIPRARHHRSTPSTGLSPAMEALLARTRLKLGSRTPAESLRVAGLPVLIAAVVAGGPGWTTYFVHAGDTLGAIARRHGTDVRALSRVNGLKDSDQLAVGQKLAVPVPPSTDASKARRRAAASGLHPVDNSGAPALSYRVREGDTISEIAVRSGSSVRAVLAANGLRPTGVIRPGQLIVLPSLRAAGTAKHARRPRPLRPVVHVVQTGESAASIAERYGLSATRVLAANRRVLTPPAGRASPGQGRRALEPLPAGKKLILPGATARPARPVGTTSAHVVRRGETVTAIARRYGVSVAAVLAVNHLTHRTTIYPGRRLLVPVGVETGTRRRSTIKPGADAPSIFLGRTYPEAVTRAAAANRAALARIKTPDKATTKDLIRFTAHRYGVDPALALAVGSMESGFDQRQVSAANAIGVMQVLPSSGAWAGELLGRRLDLLEAGDNVTAGVVLLATLGHQGDEQTALAGYYQGLTSVRRHGMFADTRRYVATVRTLKLRFR